MMIVPEKPPLSEPTWAAALVTPSKVSKARTPAGIGRFPSCVIKIGIEVGLDGLNGPPLVSNVRVEPETAPKTTEEGDCWPKFRMVPALAVVGRPSKAAHPKARAHGKSRAKTGTRFVADRIGVYSSGLGLRSFGGLVKDPS